MYSNGAQQLPGVVQKLSDSVWGQVGENIDQFDTDAAGVYQLEKSVGIKRQKELDAVAGHTMDDLLALGCQKIQLDADSVLKLEAGLADDKQELDDPAAVLRLTVEDQELAVLYCESELLDQLIVQQDTADDDEAHHDLAAALDGYCQQVAVEQMEKELEAEYDH